MDDAITRQTAEVRMRSRLRTSSSDTTHAFRLRFDER
jgi:hypothetical protein